MKTTIPNLRRIIRETIKEAMDPATKRNLENLEADVQAMEQEAMSQQQLVLDIIEELRDAEDGVPVNALYNILFRDVDPQVLTDEIDHLVDIGYAQWQADVLYLGHIPPYSQYA